jgi:hypothetical protein
MKGNLCRNFGLKCRKREMLSPNVFTGTSMSQAAHVLLIHIHVYQVARVVISVTNTSPADIEIQFTEETSNNQKYAFGIFAISSGSSGKIQIGIFN